jgi:hypothetical protein
MGLTATCLLSACECSDNGDLDGMWHITRVDSITNGASADVRKDLKFWSFQDKLVQLFNYHTDSSKEILMARFEHSDKLLIISTPFIYNRLDGDIFLSDDSLYLLYPHGINCIPDTFTVEKLNRKKMQLSDDVVRLYFEKY